MSAAALLLAAALAVPSGPEANDPKTWEPFAAEQTGGATQCRKYEAPGRTPVGSAEGDTVVLHEHDPEWFGNGWALLVVKAGQVRDLHWLPAPGEYRTSTGEDVSQWIICKGELPVAPPPPTTTAPPPPPEHPATPVCLVPGKGIYDHDDPRCVPEPTPAPAPPPEEPAPVPPAQERLPETGTGTRLALLGGATLSIGLLVELVTRYVLRRTPR